MAKLKSITTSVDVSSALETTPTVAKVNVYTLPLETFVVNFANSVKGDKPKVILELACPIEGIGTVQVFAPSYLTFDEQRAHLAEYFEHGDTVVGADNQPEFTADSADGLFFKRYELDGPNYEIVSPKSALGKMKATGLNSSVMEFGTANKKLSRQQIETATNLARGNYAKVAVQSEGGVMSWLSNILK